MRLEINKDISCTVLVLVFLYYQMNYQLNRKTVWIKKKKITKTLACFLATAQLKLLNISTQSNVNLTMLSLKC